MLIVLKVYLGLSALWAIVSAWGIGGYVQGEMLALINTQDATRLRRTVLAFTLIVLTGIFAAANGLLWPWSIATWLKGRRK